MTAHYHDGPEYDFELQASAARAAEEKLVAVLNHKKFEMKTERKQWHEKGNIVFEYEAYKQPSGIARTEADYWVHELRTPEDETLIYMMIPMPILRRLANQKIEEGGFSRRGGENKAQEMLLCALETLFERLKMTGGQGDAEFLTPRQRKKMKKSSD